MTGTVKFFTKDKGYGFVTSPEIVGDLFVHYSDIAGKGYRELNEGDRVEFEVADNERRAGSKKAINVRLQAQGRGAR